MEEIDVVFVDDEQPVLDSLKRLLRKEKLSMEFHSDPSKAIERLQVTSVRVIVTDLLMPKINGMQLIERAREISPDTVRIVLSGHAQVPMILSAINRGEVFRFLTKPWRVNDEAKEVIFQALEYSNLLKMQKQACILPVAEAEKLFSHVSVPVAYGNESGTILFSSPGSDLSPGDEGEAGLNWNKS